LDELMILRRLANALRRQDWFTVLIELLIVVVGIFIGLQVDDWNQRRIEKRQVHSYLEKLRGEVSNNVLAYREAIDSYQRSMDLFESYFNHLADPSQPMPDIGELSAQLCRNGVLQYPRYDNSAYDEMLSTGYLRQIPEDQLRELLREYRARQTAAMKAFDLQAASVSDAFDRFEPFRNLEPLSRANLGNCSFDFKGFEVNPIASSWIADAQRLHSYFAIVASSVLEVLEEADQLFGVIVPNKG
jgi:hypothetical protein